ncbi:uncharacterized protein [Asterias amurensis]|uniref:uncharacterized protein n=1 Tax=Asterias amurensis TaxID=7602 RepID=UPI003AB5ECA0
MLTMGMSLIKVALWASLIVASCFKQSLAGTDSTIVPGTNGRAVVDATISKIAQVERNSQLQPDDRLLLRIAWVETKFGTAPNTYSDPNYHGGIWRVDRDTFDVTLRMFNTNEYSDIFQAITTKLGINWIQVIWEDCRRPLYSGLAARLFLHKANPVIPRGWSVQGQANYWRDYYPHVPPTGNTTYFSQEVSEIGGCTSNGIDLVFVLDGSGSVGVTHFETSKTFVKHVVDFFKIGSDDTRVGVIQYSSSVNIEFHLNQYTEKSSLQQAIANISYIGGGTETEAALNVMVDEGFSVTNGARELEIGIPRVAVVITDGRSQGPDRVRVPADRAREEGIQIFAIGVTSSINEAELNAIANEPHDTYVFEVSNFDAIPNIGATLQDKACNQVAVLPVNITKFNLTIGQNQTQNIAFQIGSEGKTMTFQSTDGTIVVYGSATVKNPNSALNDFNLTATEGQGSVDIFIGSEFFNRSSDGDSRRRRQAPNQNDTEANDEPIGILYISIEGKQANNVFSLVTAKGDVTKPEATEPETTQPEGTQADTTKPGNGVGMVTATGPYIAMIMLIARLASVL